MNLVNFGIYFHDIFIPLISALVLASISFILFYIFKRSNDKLFSDFQSSRQNLVVKKKIKKKNNSLKAIKSIEFPEFVPDKQRNETKHIEIKSQPEILNDDLIKEITMHSLSPTKPILRKTDEEIFINRDECKEAVWSKIPKDEVAILRSRHSSVVSEIRLAYKDDEVQMDLKLSKGQKKRQRTKLKTSNSKVKEINNDIQSNNSSIIVSNEMVHDAVEKIVTQQSTDKLNVLEDKHIQKHTKNNVYMPSGSTQIVEKIQTQQNGCHYLSDNFSAVLTNNKKMVEEETNYDHKASVKFNPFINDFNNSEDKLKLELEIKELKEERYKLLQKLHEFPSMAANILALQKDNDLYLKKYEDLERTCNVMKKELTSTIQKNSTIENQFMRFKVEKNQQFGFYENENAKLTNKSSFLENDLRTKAVEHETYKDNIEKLHHLVSEKDKYIQNQNIEILSLKDQLFKKRIEYQDLESQIKNTAMKVKETENQRQLANREIEKLNTQLEIANKERKNIQHQFEQLRKESKAQEQQQYAIISSFQYQLDEFSKEKQQYLLYGTEDDDEKIHSNVKQKNANNNNPNDTTIPEGFQLIECSTLKKFTALINEGNQKLQEKCDHFNLLISEYKDKEASLIEQNTMLINKYSKLNCEMKSHLKEIVHLRKCIEELQQELTKNSETTLEEMRLELDEKCDTLRKTEDILAKLELSVDDEERRWQESLSESKQENLRLENELRSQALLLDNQSKHIIEMTSMLQSYGSCEPDAMFNGTFASGCSETSNQ